MQTTKQGQRMWYSIKVREDLNPRTAEEKDWGWAQKIGSRVTYTKTTAGVDGVGEGAMGKVDRGAHRLESSTETFSERI